MTVVLAVICSPPLSTLYLVVPQPHSGESDGGQKKVALIIHVNDQQGNPIAPNSVKDIQVTEHGRKLAVVDGPKSAGRKQIVLLLDSNFHQQEVLALEQQTAVEMLSELEKEKAQALVMSYGAEIHSSGELTEDLGSLRTFTGSLRAETDKRNETVLLCEAMKRAIERLYGAAGTKAVVVLAEGNDLGSSVNWKTLARLAQRTRVACYVIFFANHSFYGRGVRHYGYYLVELAPKTGGRLWEVGDIPGKAKEAAHGLLSALDSQCFIEVLVPDVHANRFHAVKVTSPGYQVTAQTGYFDEGIQIAPAESAVLQELAATPPDDKIEPENEPLDSPSETSDDPRAMFRHLADGGYGFLLGDGALNYGRENIVEAYYTGHVWRGIYVAPGLQRIVNPGYNRDRGPVLVPSLRLHLEL